MDDSGSALTLPVGAPLTVNLQLRAANGFKWGITQNDETVVALQGEPRMEPLDSAEVGGRVEQVFSFVTKTPGMAHLEIALRRPWEKGPAARVFDVDITVR